MIERGMVAEMKKEVRDETVSTGSCPDAEFLRRYPSVCDYLTATKWDDGSVRRTSTIMLMVEDGAIKACLNDRDGERSLWRAGETFGDAIGSLEAALRTETQDWRRWNQNVRARRGK